MGLERTASVLQGVDSNYRTDLFVPIIDRLAAHLGHRPEEVEAERFSYQVVADHSRAMTFLIAEGVHPSNEGPGYVLRRIMRRAVRHVRLMGISAPVLGETCTAVIEVMGDAYPQLVERRDDILAEVQAEEQRFSRTLQAGSERLAQQVEAAGAGGTISGDDAFRLHDTFGFPIDLTIEIAAESDVAVDREGFETAMAAQRERSRGAQQSAYQSDPELAGLTSEFIGYPNETAADGLEVLAVRRRQSTGRRRRSSWPRPRSTPRAAARSAIADGWWGRRGRWTVADTQRDGDAIVHLGALDGSIAVGERVRAEVDDERRLGGGAQPHRHPPPPPGAARRPRGAGQAGRELGRSRGPALRLPGRRAHPARGPVPGRGDRQRAGPAQPGGDAHLDVAGRGPGVRRGHVLRREVPARIGPGRGLRGLLP